MSSLEFKTEDGQLERILRSVDSTKVALFKELLLQYAKKAPVATHYEPEVEEIKEFEPADVFGVATLITNLYTIEEQQIITEKGLSQIQLDQIASILSAQFPNDLTSYKVVLNQKRFNDVIKLVTSDNKIIIQK